MRVIVGAFLWVFALSALAAEPAARVLISTPEAVVTEADVQHYILERLGAGHSADVFNTPKGIAQSAENLLSLRLLASRASAAGVVVDEQMQWELDLYRDRLLHRKFVNESVERELKATNWERVAREEFNANPGKYAREIPERVSASHILVALDGRTDEEALARLTDISERLAKGGDFNELAVEFSDDPSAKNNKGNLGYFAKSAMVTDFADVAFGMTVKDSISNPVKTRFGYHLIKYQGRQPSKKTGFDDVKGNIIASEQSGLRKVIQDRLTAEARSVNNAVVDEAVLQSLFQSRSAAN